MSKKVKSAKDLKQDTNNANAGNERGNALIATSLDRVGAGRSVVVDADGNLLAGNKTAAQWGDKPVRVIETDGNELVVVQRNDISLEDGDTAAKARELALFDNRAAELNLSWVPANLMQSKLEGADLEVMFDAEEWAEVDRAFNDTGKLEPSGAGADTPPEVSRADELKAEWGTELGQLWSLGQHRLICGDCTDADVVARLMDGARADAVITDPPYGINLNTDNSRFSGGSQGHIAKKGNGIGSSMGRKIVGDDKPFDPSFLLALADSQIIWGWNHFPDHLPRGSCLVWIKRNDDAFGTFLSDAEVAYKSDGHGVYCNRDLTNNAIANERQHPTQKPVGIMEWCMGLYPDALHILDPFLGSGTTLIAAHNLDRICFGCEISPSYCAVILNRFKEHTGIVPELIE